MHLQKRFSLERRFHINMRTNELPKEAQVFVHMQIYPLFASNTYVLSPNALSCTPGIIDCSRSAVFGVEAGPIKD